MTKLLNSRQVAEYLNLEPVTVRRKAAKGEIPSVRIGNRFRFDQGQIDRWLLQQTVGKPAHILVVDDDPVIGDLFTDSLKNHNYQVTTALSSVEALRLLANDHFDFIFLDLVMPELDGGELFRRIRQMDERVPVAIITGYPDSDLMNRAMEQGPFLVMKKPFDSAQILEAVRSFTQAPSGGSQYPPQPSP